MITGIIQTEFETFAATIDGTQWFNITPTSRFYVMVQTSIAAGAVVTQAE